MFDFVSLKCDLFEILGAQRRGGWEWLKDDIAGLLFFVLVLAFGYLCGDVRARILKDRGVPEKDIHGQLGAGLGMLAGAVIYFLIVFLNKN